MNADRRFLFALPSFMAYFEGVTAEQKANLAGVVSVELAKDYLIECASS
jgi:hypothetical protein